MRLRRSTLRAPKKAAMLQKEVVARIQSRMYPVYLVNEYPKSGGTWLKYMLADVLGYPAWTKGRLAWAPCVMQAHWLAQKGRCRNIVLFRDGRDVMVSYYYHSLFLNELQNKTLVEIARKSFDFSDLEDIRANLLPFMKRYFDAPIAPSFSWLEFVNTWANRPNTVVCKYEDLRRDTRGEVCRLYRALTGKSLDEEKAQETVIKHSMENMRKKHAEFNPGVDRQENAEISFIRKGSVGGWSECFTDEALEWFEDKAGSALDAIGYSRGRPKAVYSGEAHSAGRS